MIENKFFQQEGNWMSMSDLMTGLMIVFLFIAVAYMSVQQTRLSIFEEYSEKQNNLYKELDNMLMEYDDIQLNRDLSIVILSNDLTFRSGSSHLETKFMELLDDFFLKYISILLNDEYRGFIKEIRIEGHTDDVRFTRAESEDAFIGNVELSQDRSRHVLEYVWHQLELVDIPPKDSELLRYWITANGLSYGRMVDRHGELVFRDSHSQSYHTEPSGALSRRVEFRIITNSSSIIDSFNGYETVE